ncbi:MULTISPECIES: family 2 glycosyl transferase [unclassified Nocardiopsis]|uniref:family 2 glycosyl transferase n=1 Tax=unclassified Nocardiopsis TaxID=2649073 RepID=UPI0033E92080
MAAPAPAPLPVGLGIEIDRSVRLADEGHVLVGGSPPSALRLSPEGVSAVIRWLSGAAPDSPGERGIARALVEVGLAHPRPSARVPVPEVRVVVVGGGRHDDLESTLDHLGNEHPNLRPRVVGTTCLGARVARARGLSVVPGPLTDAEALEAALGADDTPVVALLEAGARPAPGWLAAALGHFADPAVAAVVPRVLSERVLSGPLGMSVASLDASAADRGPDPARIDAFGAAEAHAPPPALLLRRGPAAPGPDPGPATAVELLRRLCERGWSVRYEPRSRVYVPPRTRLGPYLSSRFEVGATVGALARQHGGRGSGPELPVSGVLGLGLALLGRPVAGLAVYGLAAMVVAERLARDTGVPVRHTLGPVAADLARTSGEAARFARTTHWPLTAAVAVGGAALRSRRRSAAAGRGGAVAKTVAPGLGALAAAAVLTVPHLLSWRRRHGAAPVGPLMWTGLAVAGDAARSCGTWWGAVRSGSAASLVPRVRPPVSAVSLESVQVVEGTDGPVRKSRAGLVLSPS